MFIIAVVCYMALYCSHCFLSPLFLTHCAVHSRSSTFLSLSSQVCKKFCYLSICCSPLMEGKLVLELEAMEKIASAQAEVSLTPTHQRRSARTHHAHTDHAHNTTPTHTTQVCFVRLWHLFHSYNCTLFHTVINHVVQFSILLVVTLLRISKPVKTTSRCFVLLLFIINVSFLLCC